MAKKATKTPAHAPSESAKPADQRTPALVLFDALRVLASDARGDDVRSIAENRRLKSAAKLQLLNHAAWLASQRANARSAEGASFEECMGELAEADRLTREAFDPAAHAQAEPDPAKCERSPESFLSAAVGRSMRACANAKSALRDGGGSGLDARAIHKRLSRAEKSLAGLSIGLGMPTAILDNYASELENLAEWAADTRDDLLAVMELGKEASGSQSQGGGDTIGPGLTGNQTYVLEVMARFDPSRLLSAKDIVREMEAERRLSENTTLECVTRLIELDLAERPEGNRSGARLNGPGRRLAR